MRIRSLLLMVLLSALALSGCIKDDGSDDGDDMAPLTVEEALEDGITTPAERERLPFVVTDARSHTLLAGEYGIEDARSVFVDVDLPATEGGQAIDPIQGPQVHLGLFLPEIEGCDWDAPSDCPKVPVIADVGPYYATPDDQFKDTLPLFGEGDVPADERGSGRLGEFLIDRFVPHGYAVAQVSVFGSGQSNHCFDVFGLGEQLGVKAAVDWLGSEEWSNGNVGLIGRSYDGSTPWMAANHGSEYLKTIVPISGLSGLGDLVTWNGASEARVATFQNVIYGRFGFDSSEAGTDAINHLTCPDWTTATAWGGGAYATGDDVVSAEGAFWDERHFIPGAVANYDGSMYMIHGLQDNNVDPHAGWIGELALRANGNDVRSMWGQWYHNYPDRVSEHGWVYSANTEEYYVPGTPSSIRMDWAQELLEWFDFYLMEKDGVAKPALHYQVQELDGPWRIEPVWPPTDADVRDITLGDGTIEVFPDDPGDYNDDAPSTVNVLDLGVLSETEDVLMAGFSTITLTVTPTGPGGQVYVELRDGTDGHDFGLSYGIMELRHATGESAPVTPGMDMEIEIPFQNFDARLPAGHSLELYVHGVGNGFLPSAVSDPVIVDLSASILHLSTLDRDDSYYYTPPVWWVEDDSGAVIGQKGATTVE